MGPRSPSTSTQGERHRDLAGRLTQALLVLLSVPAAAMGSGWLMWIVGRIPVMFDTGIGSDVAKRIAAPLWSGLVSLTLLTLAAIPAVYVIWRERELCTPG